VAWSTIQPAANVCTQLKPKDAVTLHAHVLHFWHLPGNGAGASTGLATLACVAGMLGTPDVGKAVVHGMLADLTALFYTGEEAMSNSKLAQSSVIQIYISYVAAVSNVGHL
jgi:hypothetical protein